MEMNHVKALLASYYLSKFDTLAYERLGYGGVGRTHEAIGEQLGVNPNSIKNMRDEFDPYHNNARAGWHQRDLRPSRRQVMETYSDMSEIALHQIVVDLLAYREDVTIDETLRAISSKEKLDENSQEIDAEDGSVKRKYSISRVLTGKQAEDVFMGNWKTYFPNAERVTDRTNDGCGYDFLLEDSGQMKYVEVKGTNELDGSVLLTDKEWYTAYKEKNHYYLFHVAFDGNDPLVTLICDPYNQLSANKRTSQIVQVTWTIAKSELAKMTG